ncbi:NADH-quinone oxidoreductase subunit G [Aeromicrobium senzhongii]|uniref:NADH-quinone oxidoreductase n=1 Tax=Aeromicrobium senzhongii TaxID=2663859 RepID=A0ABX6SWF5_9ACTN|nr:NADH-quinone oxidoreductase subunit G [Aeromicrobium senzhongii]MTB88234.1 NADH-quinone oxidoreductase subunit G [Aeromicrobium senzhongii]QNL94779.1 NADH-quinone oxidoreductase subunit G [Aeromicrobium senzhongii]
MTLTESNGADTTPVELITLTIDDVEVSVPKGTLVIRAAELIGTEIPRFCDHPLLAPVGACRQCLVEIPDAGNGRGMPKPQASCTIEAAPGMVVRTQVTSPVAEKAQEGILEFLLANHPLDCPVCDKGGECPLQNQALSHGAAESRFIETKRLFPKPLALSSQVLLDRERCVLCQRCTRFQSEIAGDPFIALLERGAQQQIGIAPDVPFGSYFSGNTIQICPVGALTSADYRFRSRPFDLISVPSVSEHDACGSAIRVDHRRGKVMRRLAGDDPEVNEEWITDKDRFAFTWSRQADRLTTPLVRNPQTGELEPTSWPGALAVAARGLAAAAGKAVLTGGRLTVEDAYAYAKFARVSLGTNNIDFRARATSKEEAEFLAAKVAGTPVGVSFADLERADTVVLVGLEPEDEAGTLFLRLRKASRKGVKVIAIASHTTRGLTKMNGTLVPAVPGGEAAALAALDLPAGSVILAGERLATVPGALSAVAARATETGARWAWVPRRAGDRSALDAGCLPNLLPGGRPVASAEARADVAADWGVPSLPAEPGLDTEAIIAAAASGELGALVVAGVDVDDLPDPALARDALRSVDFLVSLEVRESAVTALADVVLPVAPPVEKAGTFINWEGRLRPFDQVLFESRALPDVRVLAGIAEELGRPIGLRTPQDAAAEWHELGPWDGKRAPFRGRKPGAPKLVSKTLVLDTWKLMIDDGRLQDGAETYRLTARVPVLRANAATLAVHGVEPGTTATLTGPSGSAHLIAEVADLPDGVVWAPTNSGVHLGAALGVGHGGRVSLAGGAA